MKISQTSTELWVVKEGFFWKKPSKQHNSETKKGGTIILERDTLSLPNTHSYKFTWRYHEQ